MHTHTHQFSINAHLEATLSTPIIPVKFPLLPLWPFFL
uniref:Uncharacterized protein n=1 Tax=Rhizophora mucronata TaxID=61149 RepID=A0A2P2P3W6_RHIMU